MRKVEVIGLIISLAGVGVAYLAWVYPKSAPAPMQAPAPVPAPKPVQTQTPRTTRTPNSSPNSAPDQEPRIVDVIQSHLWKQVNSDCQVLVRIADNRVHVIITDPYNENVQHLGAYWSNVYDITHTNNTSIDYKSTFGTSSFVMQNNSVIIRSDPGIFGNIGTLSMVACKDIN
jgi:hypothetical protein